MDLIWKIPLYLVGCAAFLAVLWLLMLCAKRKKRDFYGLLGTDFAHRGLHDKENGVPENSLAAFRLAVENGYGAELDVHLTKDHELVVMHDESLKRTAGADVKICDLTLRELEEYRLDGTQEKIPRLEEVLELFAGKQPLVVEIKTWKGNYAEITRRTCELLDRYPDLRFCMESFDPRVLLWLRRHRPEIVRGLLSFNFFKEHNGQPAATVFIMSNLLVNFLVFPHFVAFKNEDRDILSFRLCRKLWGVQEVNWTVRDSRIARAAKEDGRVVIFEHCRP